MWQAGCLVCDSDCYPVREASQDLIRWTSRSRATQYRKLSHCRTFDAFSDLREPTIGRPPQRPRPEIHLHQGPTRQTVGMVRKTSRLLTFVPKNQAGGNGERVDSLASPKAPPSTAHASAYLQILRLQSGPLGYSPKHARANFLVIVKCKDVVYATRMGKNAVGIL